MPRRGRLLLVGLLALVLAAVPASGLHSPEHRYYVVGQVTGESGQPLCGASVRATNAAGGEMGTATTDLGGRYSIMLHVHSGVGDAQPSNVGEAITVDLEAAGLTETFVLQRNPENPDGWGQKTVNFPLVRGVEDACAASAVSLLPLVLGAVAVAAGVLISLVFLRRRPRRSRGARRALMEVPGVGRGRARELEAAGIRSLEDLASAEPDELAAETGMTPKQARQLVRRAGERLRE